MTRQPIIGNDQIDMGPAMGGQLGLEPVDHLRADPFPAERRIDSEVQQTQVMLSQLVHKKTDNLVSDLGRHTDTVPLANGTEEIFLGPWIVVATDFDGQNPPPCHDGSSSEREPVTISWQKIPPGPTCFPHVWQNQQKTNVL